MRWNLTLAALVCSCCAFAQTGDSPEMIRARAEVEKLRALVAAGAAPRKDLEKAEDRIADAQDEAFLRRTLYGSELTVEQADEMIAASGRRFDRRKQAYDDAKKLVDAGVASELSLDSFIRDMQLARKECDLAESRAKLTEELAAMASAEEALETRLAEKPQEAPSIAERYDGDGVFTSATFTRVESAFEHQFGKPMPVSAMGETAVHRALGFDHRGRVDVAIFPDTPEGVWLRDYLTTNHIPYFAFRRAVPGKATGAHIHIGPMSTRLKLGG
jgi:hypothetical protein